jgi:multimeric flavodoxin WrbA
MNKTIAIIGSSRRNGNTGKLIDTIASKLAIEVIDLADLNISTYDYEHGNMNDDFLPTIKYILTHDNIIFASPVYWYAMSAQMKTFFDRITDLLSVDELKSLGRKLRGKVGFVVSTSMHEQIDDSFINSFTDTFHYLGMNYGGAIHSNCKDTNEFSEPGTEISTFIEKFSN